MKWLNYINYICYYNFNIMNVSFYKELHQAEFVRKKELDDSVNMPIGVITLIMGLLSYIVKSKKILFSDCILLISTFIIVVILFLSLCYLIRTVNTFFTNYDYKYWGSAEEILGFENSCIDYNSKVDNDSCIDMEYELKKKFSYYATYNKKVNDIRAYNLFLCRNTLIICAFLSFFLLMYSFLK